ncbi:ATP-binding protein [Haloimpatiens sp. FM7330]|uniref:sensor histidine kinase n=1 Tax=Haloimpatiens sp. FM7330 TaxID=3298610 RepID=UPI003637AEEF
MSILKNKEIRKSLYLIIIVNIIFALIVLIVGTKEISKIKSNYLQEKAYSIGYLSNKYPDMTTDIIKSNFQTTNNELREQGLKILKDYGYYDDLDVKYFENLYKPISGIVWSILFVFLINLLVQVLLTYTYHKKIYKRINTITMASKQILSQNYDVDIMQYEEGEFSKLAYAFNEMRDVIKNQMSEIKKEKEFLVKLTSDISHQLKTPLSSIIVFNDILLNKVDEDDSKYKFLLKSKTQLGRMEWLIKSILKLSKIDAKAIKFNFKSNNISLILRQGISDLETIAMKNNVKVNFNHVKNISINCDKEWVKEAFINIIKNGIEHSKDGEINISIEDNPVLTKINIQDNGEGIKKEDISKIFTRFHKSNKSNSVGIGLSLAKAIVEAHSGYIEVKSKYGEGSLFKVVFIK